MSEDIDRDRDEVRLRLGAAGLPATDAEVSQLAEALPMHRAQIALLWAVEEARYAEPGLIFHAEPDLAEWTGK
jgi:hypothetical protein